MRVELNYADDTVWLIDGEERTALPIPLAELNAQAVIEPGAAMVRFTLHVDSITTVPPAAKPPTEVEPAQDLLPPDMAFDAQLERIKRNTRGR